MYCCVFSSTLTTSENSLKVETATLKEKLNSQISEVAAFKEHSGANKQELVRSIYVYIFNQWNNILIHIYICVCWLNIQIV